MAERYGDELAAALPEVDLVAGFGIDLLRPARLAAVPVTPASVAPGRAAGPGRRRRSFDLLELPRPASGAPWAYVKVAEGCDRICGFCAIPSFRGQQRSRTADDDPGRGAPLWPGADGRGAGVREIVLVAQDLASYGRDRSRRRRRGRRPAMPIVELTRCGGSALVERTRLLYLYPSGLTDDLV